MTKKPQKKKTSKKKPFQGYYPPNAKISTQKALYDNQLIGMNPGQGQLNFGH